MSFEIVEEQGFIRITMFGVLSGEDLVELQAAAERIEEGRDRVPPRLADMRGVTELQIRYPEVSGLAEARRSRRFPNAFKSAIVVANPVQSGMARMFRTLNDNPQIMIEVFMDEVEALAWLLA
jgi:hypothetical protein